KTFAVVTLGCTKNVVDSEGIEQTLAARGYTPVVEPRDADTIIVNTCGFIGASKQESVDTILRLAADKRPEQKLIASGCLIERCAFCAIPSMKGRMRSKEPDQIIREAKELTAAGVREIVLVGQDTTAYNRDRGDLNGLAHLLRRLADEVPSLGWVRIMYAYPQ